MLKIQHLHSDPLIPSFRGLGLWILAFLHPRSANWSSSPSLDPTQHLTWATNSPKWQDIMVLSVLPGSFPYYGAVEGMRADIRISHVWKISWFSYHVVRHAWRNLGYYFCKYCKVISVLRSHWFEYKTKQCLRLKQSVTMGNGEGNGTPLQYSCLENPMDGGAWETAVHGVAKSQTRLSNFILTFMYWRRKWQPTPVFLPGESQGWGSLVGWHPWGRTESDTTEVTKQQQQQLWGQYWVKNTKTQQWSGLWNHHSHQPSSIFPSLISSYPTD